MAKSNRPQALQRTLLASTLLSLMASPMARGNHGYLEQPMRRDMGILQDSHAVIADTVNQPFLRSQETSQRPKELLFVDSRIPLPADAGDKAFSDSPPKDPSAGDAVSTHPRNLEPQTAALGASIPGPFQETVPHPDSGDEAHQAIRLVVIIDSRVADAQALLDGADPNAEVHLLDGSRSATAQITGILSRYKGLDALHIISHGSEGEVYLGGETLSLDSLDAYADDLSAWGTALSTGGDILLYGCHVAGGDGQDFVEAMAQTTGADIAASTDLTSGAEFGGDWELEAEAGDIDADTWYAHILGTYVDYEALPLTGGGNSDPVFNDGTSAMLTVNEGAGATDISNRLDVTDTDADQTLTWSQSAAPGSGSLNISGTASTGSGGTTNATPGTATYTPDANISGSDSFQVRVEDSESGSDSITVNVTINDVDPVIGDEIFSVDENSAAGTSVGTVSNSGDVDGLSFSITGGTGQSLFDINGSSGAITVATGADLDFEGTNSYTLNISVDDEDADTSADDTATLTINLNDVAEAQPSVTLGLSGSPLAENGGTATVTATLDSTSSQDVTATLAFSGTATGSGTDYTASSAAITVSAGNTTGTVTITGVDDTLDETDETVIVDITDVTNGTEDGVQQVTAAITDDDPAPTVQFTAATQSGAENEGAMTATVQLSAVSGKNASVPFTVTGTATGSGTDYTVTGSPVTINAGSTTGTITITPNDDTLYEDDETVVMTLGSPTNATASGQTVHTATIGDDDDDNDGVDADVEDDVPNPGGDGVGDGNGDSQADSTQANVASVPAAVGDAYATLEAVDGLPLSEVQASPAPSGAPAGVSFPYGVFSFSASGVTGTLNMSVFVPYDPDINGYWKQGNDGAWQNIADSVTQQGNKTRIDFSITDNGNFDTNATLGLVGDPGGPAVRTATQGPVPGTAPIPTLSEWMQILMAGLLAAWGALGLRRRSERN